MMDKKPLCELTHLQALARIEELENGHVPALLGALEGRNRLLGEREGELARSRSHHMAMVARCALLRQRPDLPADRLPAYAELVRLQGENAAMRVVLATLSRQLSRWPEGDMDEDWASLPDRLRVESEEDDALRRRLGELLTGVAAGLKGPPAPRTLHDWSDLPALAAARTAQLAVVKTACAPLVDWFGALLVDHARHYGGLPMADDTLLMGTHAARVTAGQLRHLLHALCDGAGRARPPMRANAAGKAP